MSESPITRREGEWMPHPATQPPENGNSSFAAPAGSATCEWETASPPKTCGRPAVFVTSGKFMCQEHGDAINRRWPGAAKPLLSQHKLITQKQFEDYFISVVKECKSMTRDELVEKCVLLEHALLVANGTEIQNAPAPNDELTDAGSVPPASCETQSRHSVQ